MKWYHWTQKSIQYWLEGQIQQIYWIKIKLEMWPQVVTVMFLWLAFTLGCYILYHLIDYMNNKPPGQQTLLDVLYSKMLILYIAIGLIFSINFTLQEVEHRSMISTMLVGYGSSTLVFGVLIHFTICGALRFVMIYSPAYLSQVPDQKVEIWVW